jgi:ribosomal protein S18 acetylase RimI-like enzyme
VDALGEVAQSIGVLAHHGGVYRPGIVPPMKVRDLDHARDAVACDAIVAGLPAWFGDPQGIVNCAAAVRSQDGLVAGDGSGVVGFLTWERVGDEAAEITWMAVRADRRREGVGSELLDDLMSRLGGVGIAELRVKTLSEREPYPPYEETRAFYHRHGFKAVAELDIWGPDNPAALLSRVL